MQGTQRDQLISSHADVARRIALKKARRCPDWVARDDLVAAGMLGLPEAAERHDGTRNEPFLSFAEHRIRGAVLDELRRGDLLPRRVRQLARKISMTIRELERRGEVATDQRVADALGVDVENDRTDLAHLIQVDVEPIDAKIRPLRSDRRSAPDAQAAHREMVASVRSALGQLEKRDVMILCLHYIEEQTYQEITGTLHITPSRVCQLLRRAVERVRAQLGLCIEDGSQVAA